MPQVYGRSSAIITVSWIRFMCGPSILIAFLRAADVSNDFEVYNTHIRTEHQAVRTSLKGERTLRSQSREHLQASPR